MNGEKISEFFENRLSKLRFLSLSVMRDFFSTTKFFSYKRRKSCATKSEGKFFEKSLVQKPSEYG